MNLILGNIMLLIMIIILYVATFMPYTMKSAYEAAA